MASLTTLPTETVLAIFSHLPSRDLARAALVSRHLHTHTQRPLYRRITLSSRTTHGPTTFALLLRTLHSQPSLAPLIHSLELYWHGPGATEGAQILALLHVLPRIDTLSLMPPAHAEPFSAFAQQHVRGGALPLGLRRVRDVRFYLQHVGNTAHPAVLLLLAGLPRLHTLDVRFLNELDEDDGVAAVCGAEGVSEMVCLRLGYGGVPTWAFEMLLPLARSLTHFAYGDVASGGLRGFEAARVGRALYGARETLRSLVLCFREVEEGEVVHDGREEHSQTVLGSLREWPVLRSVRCSMAPLLGRGACRLVDVLPRVLTRLVVECDELWEEERTREEVVDLFKRRREVGMLWLEVVSVPRGWGGLEDVRGVADVAGVALVRGGVE